jgi:biopolymer transport protein ExbD
MAKKSFLSRPLQSEDMSLQITSMADVFIIVLVFLLKSYATGAIDVVPSNGMLLPTAEGSKASVQALKVEVSESAVLIEGQPVAKVDGFRFPAGDVLDNGVSTALSSAIGKERAKQISVANNETIIKMDPKIVVIADQRAPYRTIKTVLASAAIHGYTDIKLAVTHGD